MNELVSVVPSGEEACPVLAALMSPADSFIGVSPVVQFRASHVWRVDPTRIRMQVCMRCGASREEPEEDER